MGYIQCMCLQRMAANSSIILPSGTEKITLARLSSQKRITTHSQIVSGPLAKATEDLVTDTTALTPLAINGSGVSTSFLHRPHTRPTTGHGCILYSSPSTLYILSPYILPLKANSGSPPVQYPTRHSPSPMQQRIPMRGGS
jgi:hypothetical protein